MRFSDFKYPVRVRIDQPSGLQPFHQYDGMVGIAMVDPQQAGAIRIYFCTGTLVSMQIDPFVLDKYEE